MNCIFICVFNQEKYVEMFYLLLESILVYGNLDKDTDILVYTSRQFATLIKNSHLYTDKIVFEINDTYDTIDLACKARLDFFNLQSSAKYSNVLYLDTDIIIKDSIRPLFTLLKREILYVLEEGSITCPSDCWGKTLFDSETHLYPDKNAFTTGILLFNNCNAIKELFNEINRDISTSPYQFGCHDQPYIIYHAFKNKMYDNQILKAYVVNNNASIHTDKIIHHFPGGPGVYGHKIESMTQYLNTLNIRYFEKNISTTVPTKSDIQQFSLANKTYTWHGVDTITYLDNFEMSAFGPGKYEFIDSHTIIADFGYRRHCIKFNEDYTRFLSVREDDSESISGRLV